MLYYKGICQLTDMRRSEHDILHELFNVRKARTCPSTDGRHGGAVRILRIARILRKYTRPMTNTY